MKEPRRQVKIYLQLYYFRRCWPTSIEYLPLNGAAVCLFLSWTVGLLWHPLISKCTPLYDVPRIHDVGLPTQCRFKVGQASQPIAGSMPENRPQRWPSTNPTLGLLYALRQYISKHMAFTQCCFNIDPKSSTLAQHWNIIGWLSSVCSACYAGNAFLSRHKITRYIGPMLM